MSWFKVFMATFMVERLTALHYTVVYILFSCLWDHGFHCGSLKLLEGH